MSELKRQYNKFAENRKLLETNHRYFVNAAIMAVVIGVILLIVMIPLFATDETVSGSVAVGVAAGCFLFSGVVFALYKSKWKTKKYEEPSEELAEEPTELESDEPAEKPSDAFESEIRI
mgnify:CR=1 FL=1|jgi:Kef-type K+ transport system membrane component KefB